MVQVDGGQQTIIPSSIISSTISGIFIRLRLFNDAYTSASSSARSAKLACHSCSIPTSSINNSLTSRQRNACQPSFSCPLVLIPFAGCYSRSIQFPWRSPICPIERVPQPSIPLLFRSQQQYQWPPGRSSSSHTSSAAAASTSLDRSRGSVATEWIHRSDV